MFMKKTMFKLVCKMEDTYYLHKVSLKQCDIKRLSHKTPKGKGKGKVHPITGHEGPQGEYRYSSTLSLASELDWVGGQRHDPAALHPGKTR
jgi:hypothetical protein